MVKLHSSCFKLLAFTLFVPFPVFATGTSPSIHATSHSKYAKAHSLGQDYEFHPRDGWVTINATNLQYKYHHDKRINEHSQSQFPRGAHNAHQGLGGTLGDVVSDLWEGLKTIGPSLKVTITWYTGHDLKNPSCWANGNWSPTDESFVCALTLLDWFDRPKCFEFLELCSSPQKCVFVRVVDSCAGCAPGSHHVDLTRAAFRNLADFDKGRLTVSARKAIVDGGMAWHTDLWGPKHTH